MVDMQERGVLRFVPWHDCITEQSELDGPSQIFKADKEGVLKLSRTDHQLTADTSTAYNFKKASTRRGIALEVAQLLDFKVHESLLKLYLRAFHKSPPRGYAAVSMEQIFKCQ